MIGLIIIILSSTFLKSINAVENGTFDSETHPYVAYISAYATNNEQLFCNLTNYRYLSCTGILVDIPGFPSRRIILTGARCLKDLQNIKRNSFLVDFSDINRKNYDRCSTTDVDNTVVTGLLPLDINDTITETVYYATYSWIPQMWTDLASIGFGILLLEKSVSDKVVPMTAVLCNSDNLQIPCDIEDLAYNVSSLLESVGFGWTLTEEYAVVPSIFPPIDSDTPPEDIPIDSIGTKKYAYTTLVNTNSTTITIAMQEESTMLCGGGDYGSPLLIDNMVYGVSYFPYSCSNATENYYFYRTDTTIFARWIRSIKSDVLNRAVLVLT